MPPKVTFRPGTPADAEACGTICYEAFSGISETHNFPPDFPSADAAIGLLRWMLSRPGFHCIIAELDNQIVGSNFIDERNAIAGIGPITVDPDVQNQSIGRRLMEHAQTRSTGRSAPGVRLVQSGFHTRSLSLYAKLGFETREPLACMQGPALKLRQPGMTVRAATEVDLQACNDLCRQIHGHDRGGELHDTIAQRTATVVERNGRITGYATIIGFFGHAVGEANEDLKALIAAAPEFAGPGFLVPTRNGELFRWCLAQGLRMTQPMTLMSIL